MKKNSSHINIKFGIILSYLGIFVSLFANVFLMGYINADGNELLSQQYNLYSFSSSISSLLIILTLGLTSGYIRFATRAEKENGVEGLKKTNSVYFILLSISTLLALIVGLTISFLFISNIIPLHSYSRLEIELISIFLMIGTINVGIGFLTNIFTIFLNYKSKFILVRLLFLIFSTSAPLISLPFIMYFKSLVIYSIIHLILSSISLCIQIIYAVFFLNYRANFKIDSSIKKYFLEILKFTLYIFMIEIFIQIDANADKILLGFFAPPGDNGANAVAVGSYNIAYSVITVIGTACSSVFSAYAPKINRAVVHKKHNNVTDIFLRTTEIALTVYFLIFGGFIVCGKQFITAWLGEKQIFIYYIILIMLITNLIPYTVNVVSEIQRAYNKHKFRSIAMLAMAIFNVVFTFLFLLILQNKYDQRSENYIMLQIIGSLGVTLISSFIFHGFIMSIYNKKNLNIPVEKFFVKILCYLFITIIPISLTITIYYFADISNISGWLQTIIIGSTFLVLYCLFLFLFNRRFIRSFIRPRSLKKPIVLSNDDLGLIKKIEMDIFKDIIRVCEILKIDYFCVGGTALGAVKYGGFIPWDDDIDIAMHRKDYDLFIKEAPKYLNENYFLQSFSLNTNYLSTMSKVRDSRTTFEEISISKMNVDGGVFVDIFPIDNPFDSSFKKIKYKINVAKINHFLTPTIPFSTIKTMAVDFLSVFSKHKIIKLMDQNIKLLSSNTESEFLVCRGNIYHKQIFSSFILMKFEEMIVKLPIGVTDYLLLSYGDISKTPSKEKQVSHHYVYKMNIEKVRSQYENSNN